MIASNTSTAVLSTSTLPAKSFRWPAILIALLAGHMLLMVAAVSIATHDRSFVALPGYYERAVHWDQEQADRRQGQKLGWKIDVLASPQVDPLGRRIVSFHVTDAAGKPLKNASLNVRYFHHAQSATPQSLRLTEADADDPARFTVTTQLRNAGLWQFDLVVQAGEQKAAFQQTVTVQNRRAGGGS